MKGACKIYLNLHMLKKIIKQKDFNMKENN